MRNPTDPSGGHEDGASHNDDSDPADEDDRLAGVNNSFNSRGHECDVSTFSPNANGVSTDEGEPLIARTPSALRLNISHQAVTPRDSAAVVGRLSRPASTSRGRLRSTVATPFRGEATRRAKPSQTAS